MKLSQRPAMQYAAIEFMPITRSGNAQKRTPRTSSTSVKARQEKEAPAAAKEHPARRPDSLDHGADPQRVPSPSQPPGRCSRRQQSQTTFDQPGPLRRNTPPASSPRIIVASVGMKLNVA